LTKRKKSVITLTPARVDGPLEADGGEEGAQEELTVGVTLDVEERHPRRGLLRSLLHRVVFKKVGKPHLGVADVVAEGHVLGDGDARRLTVSGEDRPIGEVGMAYCRQKELGAHHSGNRRQLHFSLSV